MDTLNYILTKYNLSFDETTRMPLEIRDMGRDQMATLFHELGFKSGVEVGVRDGGYSFTLCQAIPGVKLYGIDPYIPLKGYRDHVRKETFDRFYEEAHAKLDPYPNYAFIKKLSMDAVNDFADESIDFVYIDGNHDFQNATNDIVEWGKKVRKGGIISGDDYFKHKGRARIHVYQVVNGYTDAEHIRPWFVLGTKEMIEGEIRDHGRSFLWVKQ